MGVAFIAIFRISPALTVSLFVSDIFVERFVMGDALLLFQPSSARMESTGYARHAYQTQIAELEHDLLEMGSLSEHMVGDAVDALRTLNPTLATDVIRRDDIIDQRDLDIEQRCLRILALQQPTASDLRMIGTVMKVITDIERVGDLAVDIAKIAIKVEREFGHSEFIDLPRMANMSRQMLRCSLQAFVKRDVELIAEVMLLEEQVDAQYRELRGQVFENMRANQDMVVADGWLFMAVHHVERIADHAVNIAERVRFMVTGQFKTHRKFQPPQG